jgi:hypothetical protein
MTQSISTNDRPPQWASKKDPTFQMVEVQRAIDQIWNKIGVLSNSVSTLGNQLNAPVTLDKVLRLISEQAVHTSAMPDYHGENSDHDRRYATNIKLSKLISTDAAGNIVIAPVAGTYIKFGSTSDYVRINPDGTLTLVGAATTFDDLSNNLVGQKVESPSSDIVANHAEGSVDFKTTARNTDYVIMNIQNAHRQVQNAVVLPHLHWWQTTSSIPNWMIQHRWQRNGSAKTTAWTSQKYVASAFTYTSGTLCQISNFGTITPPVGYNISDIIQYRIIRDYTNVSTLFAGTDPVGATISATHFDQHIEIDGFGSSSEYTK